MLTEKPLHEYQPSVEFYNAIRARLIMRGSSLNGWAKQNNTVHAVVKASLVGVYNSPRAQEIRRKIIDDLEVVQ